VNYQFNPRALQPLTPYGTVYPTLRLSGAWGVLEAEDGALMDKAMTWAAVSAAGIDASGMKGPGWRLELKPGWAVRAGARAGDFEVAKAP
jgi:hypothetical protein